MFTINASKNVNGGQEKSEVVEVKKLDDIYQNALADNGIENSEVPNFMFMIMYEQWKQEILLSDGLSEDYDKEW